MRARPGLRGEGGNDNRNHGIASGKGKGKGKGNGISGGLDAGCGGVSGCGRPIRGLSRGSWSDWGHFARTAK